MNFSNQQKGAIYILLSGLFYGLLGYFGVKIMDKGFSAADMLFWRFLISAIVTGFLTLTGTKSSHKNSEEILKILFLGAFFYWWSAWLYFISAKQIGTGLAMVLFFIYPVFVVVFNCFFHKIKITKIYYIAIFLILFGIVLLAGIDEFKFDLIGIGLGIIAAIFFAAYVIISKKTVISPLSSTFTLSIGCAAISLAFTLAEGGFKIPADLKSWINILFIGTVCTALPILLFLKGLEFVNSAKASMLSVSEPLAMMIFGYFLLGEKITILQFIGAIVILGGAMMTLIEKE